MTAARLVTSDRSCPICGADLAGHRRDADVCGPSCRRQRSRLRRLLSGQGDGRYATVAEYDARRRRRAQRGRDEAG